MIFVTTIIDSNKYMNIVFDTSMVFLLYIFEKVIDSSVKKWFWDSWINVSYKSSSIGKINTSIVIEIFSLGLNFSLDAILLIYINRISIPPINIRNEIIGIHDDTVILDIKIVDIIVWIRSIIPKVIGVFIMKMIVEFNIIIFNIIDFISANILYKILVLGIKDVGYPILLKF